MNIDRLKKHVSTKQYIVQCYDAVINRPNWCHEQFGNDGRWFTTLGHFNGRGGSIYFFDNADDMTQFVLSWDNTIQITDRNKIYIFIGKKSISLDEIDHSV